MSCRRRIHVVTLIVIFLAIAVLLLIVYVNPSIKTLYLDYSPFPVKCTEKPCSYENLSISDFSLKK